MRRPVKDVPAIDWEEAQVLAKVSLRNIAKRFGSAQLFDGFNLDVADGELLCLLGPSGSGKTTLLRMIAGLEEMDDGDIFVGDREISRLSPRDRHIGMMFQGYALYPHLTVRKNLAYPLQVRRVPSEEANRRVVEVARLLGVEKLLDRYVQQISGGEQQRVAIGRAIVQKPNLYLLDEPISNLDASLRETVRTEVRRLQRQLGATMIMVTHDQMDALAVADRIAVLGAGMLRQIGTPEDLYQRPANLFVAGFIGNMRMNLLSCRYAGGSSRALEGQGFQFPLPAEAELGLPSEGTAGGAWFPAGGDGNSSLGAGRGAACESGGGAFPGRPAHLPAPPWRRDDSGVDRRPRANSAKRGGLGNCAADPYPSFRSGKRRAAGRPRGRCDRADRAAIVTAQPALCVAVNG